MSTAPHGKVSSLPEFGLSGQVIGVTGGGKGIGRAIVTKALEAGAHVFTCSRTESDLVKLAAEVSDLPGTFAHISLDLTSADAPNQFLDFGVNTYGKLDAVINNAGVNVAKPALDYTTEEVDRLYTVNLRMLYFCSTAAARSMIQQGTAGSIVNISSKAALVAAPLRSPYSAMKAGVNQLTRSLAAEWAEHGIRVNAIAPGPTATPLFQELKSDLPLANVYRRVLLGHRPLTPEEVALPALFMVSPAAAMMTGQILAADGGASLA